MAGHAAVGVDDDLAAGQAGVAHRAADHEPAGRVDQQPVVGGVEVSWPARPAPGRRRARGCRGRAVTPGRCRRRAGVESTTVSSRTGVVAVVLDGDLGLAVGAQVGQRAVLADLGEPARQPVRQRDRQRHQLRGVVDRVAEHQALVAGALGVQRVRRRPRRGPRGRCRRPGRCRATARRCRCSRRRWRRRSPCRTSRSRSRGCVSRTVLVMSANASWRSWSPRRRRGPGRW